MSRRWFVIAIPMLWLGIFFLLPFLEVARISLVDPAIAQPPYTKLFEGGAFLGDLENYALVSPPPGEREDMVHHGAPMPLLLAFRACPQEHQLELPFLALGLLRQDPREGPGHLPAEDPDHANEKPQ